MAEKKKGRPVLPDPNQPAETQAAPELTNTAYSIAKVSGQWMLIRVRYNPITGATGSPELEKVHGDSEMDAEERFRIMVAQELFR